MRRIQCRDNPQPPVPKNLGREDEVLDSDTQDTPDVFEASDSEGEDREGDEDIPKL